MLFSRANNLIPRLTSITSNFYPGSGSIQYLGCDYSGCLHAVSHVWGALSLSHHPETFRITSNFRRAYFPHFSELKITAQLKFRALFCTLIQSRKYRFPRTTSGLAKRVINFTGSEMYLLTNSFFHENPFLEVK
jgi:hypothetical protein